MAYLDLDISLRELLGCNWCSVDVDVVVNCCTLIRLKLNSCLMIEDLNGLLMHLRPRRACDTSPNEI